MKASAPGKVILFGEHAVVYGRAALAVPVSQVRATAEVIPAARTGLWVEAPDIQLNAELQSLPVDQPLAALIRNLLAELSIGPYPNLHIRINSDIPVASGLGSGAAVSVALARALAAALGKPLSDDQVSAHVYEIEKLHHGTPSGIDNTVVAYARPVYFIKGRPIEVLRVPAPFAIVIAHTGIPAPTRESVAAVRRLWEADAAFWDVVFDGMHALARMAKEAVETGMWRHLGPLMNENHSLLQRLTVSSPELDRLVDAARQAGALGAKLSGGGRGGNMIALAPESGPNAIARALEAAGSPRVIITTVESSPGH